MATSADTPSVFGFHEYRAFLRAQLPTSGDRRGLRTQLAKALNCQSAFISQVLKGQSHFSLEHAMAITEFLELSPEEAHYFLLLVQRERAGSQKLRAYYTQQIETIHREREKIQNRIHAKNDLEPLDQMTYYSSWIYSAIHILTSTPQTQTKTAIAKHLGLPLEIVTEHLEFLCRKGLVQEKHGRYLVGSTRIHLASSSPLISKHHANWRQKALQSMERRSNENLHYSLVMCLSETDAKRVRDLLLETIQKSERILVPSPEEAVFIMGLDYFRL